MIYENGIMSQKIFELIWAEFLPTWVGHYNHSLSSPKKDSKLYSNLKII